MACLFPQNAWLPTSGESRKIQFKDTNNENAIAITLPCGKCVGCRIDNAKEWSVRCYHEMRYHKSACFITLTYAPEHLPPDGNLSRKDVQLFLKRLRKYFGIRKLRFFGCGEYGAKGRPHYHLCLFGVDFGGDSVPWRKTSAGSIIKRSPTLEKLWPFGHSSLGELNPRTAGYTARYSMKKAVKDMADERVAEFSMASLRPGIGYQFCIDYAADILAKDGCFDAEMRHVSMPRYYEKLLSELYPDIIYQLKLKREFVVSTDTEARLMARRVKFGRRSKLLPRLVE